MDLSKMFKENEKAVVCAWCKKVISGVPRADGSNISHTICQKCFDEHYPEGEDE